MIPIGRAARDEVEFRRVCYPGTETLVNLLDIRDPVALDAAERRIVKNRAREGLSRSAHSRTYAGFKGIHRHLFQDVYAWAGQERTYTTGRGLAPFATPENIGPWMEKWFAALKERGFLRDRSPEDFARDAAELVNEINAAHPLIEGNGRT